MKTLDLTLPTPPQNLACDEALLDLCEEGLDLEILRFWEPREHFVVLGYSNKSGREINEVSCRKHGIAVFRRASGGGAVLQGPGCLNFSLILRIRGREALQSITRTNTFIMERHRQALEPLVGRPVAVQGHTDLTAGNLKFHASTAYFSFTSACILFSGIFPKFPSACQVFLRASLTACADAFTFVTKSACARFFR